MQFSTAVSPQSVYTPSWKVESKYSTRVLTGNWVEERRKRPMAQEVRGHSRSCLEYVIFSSSLEPLRRHPRAPTVKSMSLSPATDRTRSPGGMGRGESSSQGQAARRCWLFLVSGPPDFHTNMSPELTDLAEAGDHSYGEPTAAELRPVFEGEPYPGLPYKHLITHHQEPSHRHLISTYDDHYNRHNYNPGLPPQRTWNRHKLLWLPEKNDFPLLVPPTNYGLYEQLKQRWLTPEAGLGKSTYTLSYPRPLPCALSRREHAIPVPPQRLQPIPRF
ncbi:hypothetical protein QTO34_019054 [Cnephaeus nilssonii]|uniref:Uncharacterized protein n=1 Tax=Cnephaeus nilssonii TaxID=3371016 RepID=A0AA40LQZ2_CNENI|nr:hypothetical protein QTO34_019054 [Eptesicus nilssonii]